MENHANTIRNKSLATTENQRKFKENHGKSEKNKRQSYEITEQQYNRFKIIQKL